MATSPSPATPSAPSAAPDSPPALGFIARFTVLRGAVRELWLVFAYVILSNLAYAMVNLTLTLWLSSDLGYSDIKAGLLVSSWSALLTLCIVMVGSLTD